METQARVLVVDDDPVVAHGFFRVLSAVGCDVRCAEDGYDALVSLQRERFDLVFTDLRMPGIDGLALAEQLHAHQPWVPVVVVTGCAGADDEARAREAGVAQLLRKPITPEGLVASALIALSRRRYSSGLRLDD